ncbi:hypothetical protein DFJ43DRAFT_1037208 [Lentinula guzmanii]|uniref:Uncharacterized protein n=1 Tax=Lentinula guzmanii TaxID=2804957 RepID=A0AA38JFY8_9AGAR|nr:hypothetical protein DFJ43DRAFT_1037208 [Lentinula guzmanii]
MHDESYKSTQLVYNEAESKNSEICTDDDDPDDRTWDHVEAQEQHVEKHVEAQESHVESQDQGSGNHILFAPLKNLCLSVALSQHISVRKLEEEKREEEEEEEESEEDRVRRTGDRKGKGRKE